MIEIVLKRIVDKEGRVIIPRALREQLNIHHLDSVIMTQENESVILKKYDPEQAREEERVCMMTGVASKNHWRFSGDIVLSKEGAVWLLDEIQSMRIKVGV
ncbi:hypothetical protein BTO30_00380 [Domibacillus antri]|uniref:SpoVT-AbrB domain-containing protein n=1 Tax=Domibacillus antri TaxID=1714264 RepID=A0A1Q8Q9A5_9BACI|nr:AbrB/MazE/SpoVT family DNA-binding domain-containing protein [Domibacillus antri]OLN23923.1 hypothetical protein BTO30_00380 [Domibacillus antri]